MDHSTLTALVAYDADTGFFTSRVNRGKCLAGRTIGWRDHNGYIVVTIRYVDYFAHRLAWFYVTGRWPAEHIDHINGTRDDNRWCNLREATGSQNQANKKRGRRDLPKGVCKRSPTQYSAQLYFDGRQVYLGSFRTASDAHDAYKVAAKQYFGEFARFE